MEQLSDLRQLQLCELEILKDIKRVCEKNNITYYLDGGTLLGAVRHKGFIPWDDDIDISMPYEDYKSFLEIAQTELGSDYFVQNADTDKNFYGAFTKVRKNNTTMMPVNHTKYHVNHGIWVDIFPLAVIGSDLEVKIKRKKIQICNYLLMEDYILANKEEFTATLGNKGMALISLAYKVPYSLRKKLHDYILGRIIKNKRGENYAVVWTAITTVYSKTIFQKAPLQLAFEDDYFSVPNDYDGYLKTLFGDYMQLPPVEDRKAHGSMILDFKNGYDKYIEK